MTHITTKQSVLRAYENDIIKLRHLKKKKQNGNEESDAEVLNRVIKEIEDKLQKSLNAINIRFDGRIS